MNRRIALIGAVAALAAAVLIPASLAGPWKGSSTTVGTQRTNLGRILVDARGHTLYLFEKDMRGTSSCNGACATAWPPLIAAGKPHAGSGVRPPGSVGRSARTDAGR